MDARRLDAVHRRVEKAREECRGRAANESGNISARGYNHYTVDYLIVHMVRLRKFSCTLGGMQEAHVTHGVTRLLICDTKQRLVVCPSKLTTM